MSSSHMLILIDWEESGFRLYTLKGDNLKRITYNLADTFQTALRQAFDKNKVEHLRQDPQMTYYVAMYHEALKYLRKEYGVTAVAIGSDTWSSFNLTLPTDQEMHPTGILASLLAAEVGRQPEKLSAEELLGLLSEIRTAETLGVYQVPYVHDWFSKTTIAAFALDGRIYLGCDSKHSEAFWCMTDVKGWEKEESKIHNCTPVKGVQVCFTFSGVKSAGQDLSEILEDYLKNLDQVLGLPDPLQIARFARKEVCRLALSTGKTFEIFLAIMMPKGYPKRASLLFCISDKMMRPVDCWITGGSGFRLAGAVIEGYLSGQDHSLRPEELLMHAIQGGIDRDSRSGGDIHALVLDQNNPVRKEKFDDEYFLNQDRNVKITDPNGQFMESLKMALESLEGNNTQWEVDDKANTIVIRKAGGRFSQILVKEMILAPICYTENVVFEQNKNFDFTLKY